MTNPSNSANSLRMRQEGFLVGAEVGAALAAATTFATDPEQIRAALDDGAVVPALVGGTGRRAPVALADALVDELLAGGVDLHRLVGRWLDWYRRDGLDADPALQHSLDHLRDFDAPLPDARHRCAASLAATLPAALTSANPQAMIAGAFHVSRLLDPTEATALATVSVVVAASRLIEGHRDFIPDVLAVLRANAATNDVVEAVARVPRDPRTPPAVPRGESPDPLAVLSWVFWTVHHRPRGVPALEQMVLAGGVSPTVGAVLGALIGARDGLEGWPGRWVDGGSAGVAHRRSLARRLPKPS